jgi:hypothetical protein
MGPNVDSLIVNHKQTLKNLFVGIKINSVTQQQFIIPHVYWCLVKGSNITVNIALIFK